MDRHVPAAQRQPTMRIHRAKPWMRKFRRRFEIRDLGDRRQQRLA